MLGGSEDDLCRPTMSNGPDFQPLDADGCPIPPRADNWPTGDGKGEEFISKSNPFERFGPVKRL